MPDDPYSRRRREIRFKKQGLLTHDQIGELHTAVTLNADTATQDSANLATQELQLVPVTATTFGVCIPADKQKLDTLQSTSIVTKTNDYSILSTDWMILVDASSNTVTITLPNMTAGYAEFIIKCIDNTFTATLDTNDSAQIDNNDDIILPLMVSITVVKDGTDWWIK